MEVLATSPMETATATVLVSKCLAQPEAQQIHQCHITAHYTCMMQLQLTSSSLVFTAFVFGLHNHNFTHLDCPLPLPHTEMRAHHPSTPINIPALGRRSAPTAATE